MSPAAIQAITTPGDPAASPVGGPALRHAPWTATLTANLPGIAAAVRLDGVLRVAVLELPGAAISPAALRDALAATRDLTTARAAQVLLRLTSGIVRPSAAVADIATDGRVTLVARDAPPAVVLSPDLPSRALAATAGPAGPAVRTRLRPADSLLLCSATFFENPPESLGEVRGARLAPHAVRDLQRRLAAAPYGATALVMRH